MKKFSLAFLIIITTFCTLPAKSDTCPDLYALKNFCYACHGWTVYFATGEPATEAGIHYLNKTIRCWASVIYSNNFHPNTQCFYSNRYGMPNMMIFLAKNSSGPTGYAWQTMPNRNGIICNKSVNDCTFN